MIWTICDIFLKYVGDILIFGKISEYISFQSIVINTIYKSVHLVHGDCPDLCGQVRQSYFVFHVKTNFDSLI